jgi:hypothetical protein
MYYSFSDTTVIDIGPSSSGAEARATQQRSKCFDLFFSYVRACALDRHSSEQNHARQQPLHSRSRLSCRLEPLAGFHMHASQMRLLRRQYAKLTAVSNREPVRPILAIARSIKSISAGGMCCMAWLNTAPFAQL